MSDLESLSREELIVLAQRQDAQITLLATQLAELMEKFEQQAAELARLQHLLSRNSGNSSMPPSKDDGPGRATPRKERRAKPSGRAKGNSPARRGPRCAGARRTNSTTTRTATPRAPATAAPT
ncbi:DUF6444 domain-containing protein [Streptomyces chiangmaiensis]